MTDFNLYETTQIGQTCKKYSFISFVINRHFSKLQISNKGTRFYKYKRYTGDKRHHKQFGLKIPSNFFDTNFHAVFYNRFNAYIASNDIYSATKILLSAGKSSLAIYQTDTLLLKTSIQFINRYSFFINPVDYADLLINIGSLYSQAGEYRKANECLSRIILDTSNTEIIAIYTSSRCEMLYNYLYTGNVDKALDCGFEALKYNVYSKYKIGIAASCAGIAGVYLYNSDIQKALFYLDHAISIIEKEKDTAGIYMMKSNRIGIYFQLKHPKLLQSIDSLISSLQKNGIRKSEICSGCT